MSILGNPVCFPGPQPDWAQEDETRADYIKNKPSILGAEGGSLTGSLSMGGNPITGLPEPEGPDQAVNKDYADRMVPKSGGTMTGNLDLGGCRLTGLGQPLESGDAVSRGYLEGRKKQLSAVLIQALWEDRGEYRQYSLEVPAVTAENAVVVSPRGYSFRSYCDSGICCFSQGAGSLIFRADQLPEGDVTVNILILD